MTEEGHIKVHSLDLFENDSTYFVNRSMYKLHISRYRFYYDDSHRWVLKITSDREFVSTTTHDFRHENCIG